jgi:hypothetical protein
MKQEGWSIHCHHDQLIEWCYDYQERIDYIKSDKSPDEQPIRLRLFKVLPLKAITEIPVDLQEADAKLREADAKWREADTKSQEAWAKLQEAWAKLQEANNKWSQKDKDTFHAKWCGCKEWNGKEIVFPPMKKETVK